MKNWHSAKESSNISETW